MKTLDWWTPIQISAPDHPGPRPSVYRDVIPTDSEPEGPHHCGVCGRMLIWTVNRFFHVLGSKRRMPPDSEMDYRIDHEIIIVAGDPEDRRDG